MPDYARLAALHTDAFTRGWSAQEIEALATGPGGFLIDAPRGFTLGRSIAGEAELLTIVVDKSARGTGAGKALLAAFETRAAQTGANTLFLEVAADNTPALALYRGQGWQQTGLRKAYYPRPTGPVDALLLRKST
ncbi:MAG: 30S ribosomal protein S18 alanine N-acetyltransferase [Rhodobacterales bacterium]|nr:MAG: 30S ribosomal protein S18 alanine N-acetyltransferase [Rhodobacterales bacterium]